MFYLFCVFSFREIYTNRIVYLSFPSYEDGTYIIRMNHTLANYIIMHSRYIIYKCLSDDFLEYSIDNICCKNESMAIDVFPFIFYRTTTVENGRR